MDRLAHSSASRRRQVLLASLLGSLALLGAPLATASAQVANPLQASLPPPGSAHLDPSAADLQLMSMINALRAQNGVDPLQPDPTLSQLAQQRSQDMLDRHYFSHDIPGTGSSVQWLTSILPDARATGENLGESTVSDDQVVQGLFSAWVNSPAHLENMVKPEFNRVGVGVVEGGVANGLSDKIATQLFAASDVPLALSTDSTPHQVALADGSDASQ